MRFEGLPIGLLRLDARFAVVDADQGMEELFGATTAQLAGASVSDLVSARDRRGKHALATRLNQYRDGIIDLHISLALGGRDHLVRLRLTRAGDGYHAFVESIGGEEDLNYQLAALTQRWTSIFRASEEGIVLLGADGVIVDHNQRFHEVMRFRTAHGIALAEGALIGKPLGPLLASRGLAGAAVAMTAARQETRVREAAGDQVIEVRGGPLAIPGRGEIGAYLIVRDVTEQQQVEQRDALIAEDLAGAQEFQRSVLGRVSPFDGVAVNVVYRPLQRVGGDVYDVAVLPGGTVRAFVADATGHGVQAALATMLIKGEYDAVKTLGERPARTLSLLNQRISGRHGALSILFSAAVVDVDLAAGRVRHAPAAHPAPFLCAGDRARELESSGTLVGVAGGLTYPEWSRELGDWQSVVLVTDGIIEARGPGGDFFGEDRLGRAIADAAHRGRPPEELAWARLEAFVGSRPLDDDVTIVGLRPDRGA